MVLIVLIILACVGLVAYFNYQKNQIEDELKETRIEKHHLTKDLAAKNDILSNNERDLRTLRVQVERLQEDLIDRTKFAESCKDQIAALEKLLAVADEREMAATHRLRDLENFIADAENRYENTRDLIAAAEENYGSRLESVFDAQNEFNDLQDQLRLLESNKVLLESQIAALEGVKTSTQDEITDLQQSLEALCKSHSAAWMELAKEQGEEEDHGWRLELKEGREERLVDLIEELIELYPELTSDFRGIEWKKIWLPKLQVLCAKEGLDGKTGVYRLRVIDNETICYVGQAVNIKERWYTHVRKMVGVEGKGSEKLYDYRPDELIWEVVEEVDRSRLNERERYWIDWWACKEVGLNKKK